MQEKSTFDMQRPWLTGNMPLFWLSLFSFFIHILVSATTAYGIFRDELYYIACSENLDWGYVDQPPLSLLLLWMSRTILGDSLPAIRFLPALAHAVTVFLTGLTARELGGRRSAQVLAALAALAAPVYLGIFDFYSMNSFDILFWALGFYVVVRLIVTGDGRLWLLLGLIAGLGIENKLSILFFLLGLAAGLVLTPHRRFLVTRWPWLGLLLTALLTAPYILWQVRHGWPTLEFMRNATLYKNLPVSFRHFLTQQFLIMGPANSLLWVAGFLFFFFSKKGAPYRIFAWMYAAIFAVFVAQNGKPYYQSPSYAVLFAAGGVAWEGLLATRPWKRLAPILVSAVAVGGALTAPMAIPILPVETYIAYRDALGVPAQTEERSSIGALDQHYADMFGWKEMAEAVARVYASLTPDEQNSCVIYAQNYGQAGAIDYFGRRWRLPRAISGHNSYWFWGPRGATGEVVIVIGGELEDHAPEFETCEQAAVHRHRYARPFETNLRIFVCRKLKVPVSDLWPQVRVFI